MTATEARDLLGVTDGVDAPSLRRAYLRAIKKHPPERDPEGFSRARAAYDLLLARLGGFTAVPGANETEAAPPAGVEVEVAPASDAAPRQAQYDRLDAIWRRYDEAIEGGDEERAIGALREGVELSTEFVYELVLQHASSLDEEELRGLLLRESIPTI